HEQGVVHGHLTPEHVFITPDDRANVGGFASATPRGPARGDVDAEGAGAAPAVEPTPAGLPPDILCYLAPEQVRGTQWDHRADLFAFGALLYEMLTGRRAFAATTAADLRSAVLEGEPASLRAIVPDVPPLLARIVCRCLEKKPQSRFH